MSLLNNMLRDIERGKSANIFQLENGLLLESAEDDVSTLRFFVPLILAVFLVLLCYSGWKKYAVPEADAISMQRFTAPPQNLFTVFEKKLSTPVYVLSDVKQYLQSRTASSLAWLVQVSAIESVLELSPATEVERNSLEALLTEQAQTPALVVQQKNPQPREPGQHLQITRSSRSLDLEAVNKARILVAKGESASAETLLLSELESNVEAIVSVQLLADLYFDRGAKNELGWLATNMHFIDNSLRAYVLARHHALGGDHALGLALLVEAKPHPLVEEAYYSLQAALYHQTAAYAEAEKLYARLLGRNNRSLSLWLGYALASDANQRSEQALSAYRQVLQSQGLNANVKSYVQGRIEILSANNLTASTMESDR